VQHDLDINAICDYDGRTPLHLAASEGAFATTDWLIGEGVDVDAVDRFGRTPLMDALLAEQVAVAQLLLTVRRRCLLLTMRA
jgi:ankyrin repeat protein